MTKKNLSDFQKSKIKEYNLLIKELEALRVKATRERDRKLMQPAWDLFKLKASEVAKFVKEYPEIVNIT